MPLFGKPDVFKMKAKRNIKGLIRAAKQKKDTKLRKSAIIALGELGDPMAVEAIAAALEDSSYDRLLRYEAVRALVKIGGQAGAAPLIAALKVGDGYTQEIAARALTKVVHPSAVQPLITALDDKNWSVRGDAAEALGKIGDSRAVEPLVVACKDSSGVVRRKAAEALEHLGWQPDEGENGAWYWTGLHEWDKAATLGRHALEPLLAALTNDTPAVRAGAARGLGAIGHPQAVEPLLAALRDKARDVRQQAAAALAQLNWQPDQEANGAWFKDRDDELRQIACRSLVQIGSPAVEQLNTVLEHKERNLRETAAELLGEIGDPRAVEPLIAALNSKSLTSANVGNALRQIADPRAAKLLIAVLKDKAGAPLDALVAAAETLGELGDPSAVTPLIAALEDNLNSVRHAAAKSLVKLYHGGMLSPEHKQRILERSKEIRGKHEDSRVHVDNDEGSCHSDRAPHTDRGWVVDFPL